MTVCTPSLSRLGKAMACFVVVLLMIQTATAATVRGRLIRYLNGGQYPAGGMAVTVRTSMREGRRPLIPALMACTTCITFPLAGTTWRFGLPGMPAFRRPCTRSKLANPTPIYQ